MPESINNAAKSLARQPATDLPLPRTTKGSQQKIETNNKIKDVVSRLKAAKHSDQGPRIGTKRGLITPKTSRNPKIAKVFGKNHQPKSKRPVLITYKNIPESSLKKNMPLSKSINPQGEALEIPSFPAPPPPPPPAIPSREHKPFQHAHEEISRNLSSYNIGNDNYANLGAPSDYDSIEDDTYLMPDILTKNSEDLAPPSTSPPPPPSPSAVRSREHKPASKDDTYLMPDILTKNIEDPSEGIASVDKEVYEDIYEEIPDSLVQESNISKRDPNTPPPLPPLRGFGIPHDSSTA